MFQTTNQLDSPSHRDPPASPACPATRWTGVKARICDAACPKDRDITVAKKNRYCHKTVKKRTTHGFSWSKMNDLLVIMICRFFCRKPWILLAK